MKLSDHIRYVNKNGEPIPSVTTILRILNKPQLLYWANSLGFRRQRYDDVLNYKASIGTMTHLLVETELKNKLLIYKRNDPILQKAIPRYYRFMEWKDVNETFKCIESELSVSSDRFGGTIDCYCELDNKKTIIDWKTSKDFYPSMFLQLAAYRELLRSLGKDVDQAGIVLLGEDKYRVKIMNNESLDKYFKVFSTLVDLFYQLDDINYNI